jgi:hypothetical protein
MSISTTCAFLVQYIASIMGISIKNTIKIRVSSQEKRIRKMTTSSGCKEKEERIQVAA